MYLNFYYKLWNKVDRHLPIEIEPGKTKYRTVWAVQRAHNPGNLRPSSDEIKFLNSCYKFWNKVNWAFLGHRHRIYVSCSSLAHLVSGPQYIYQDSKLLPPVFYFANPIWTTYFMGCLVRAICTVHMFDFCPRPARKKKIVPLQNKKLRAYCPNTYTVSLGLRNAWVIFIRFRPTLCIGAEKRAVFLVSNRDQRGLSTLKSNPIWSRIQNIYVCNVEFQSGTHASIQKIN